MPLTEYICRNMVDNRNRQPGEEMLKFECGHEQTEVRGSQVAGGNDAVVCESCGSDKMEVQASPPSWINMRGRQHLKKGWN